MQIQHNYESDGKPNHLEELFLAVPQSRYKMHSYTITYKNNKRQKYIVSWYRVKKNDNEHILCTLHNTITWCSYIITVT